LPLLAFGLCARTQACLDSCCLTPSLTVLEEKAGDIS
jgi:hypothetical protein